MITIVIHNAQFIIHNYDYYCNSEFIIHDYDYYCNSKFIIHNS